MQNSKVKYLQENIYADWFDGHLLLILIEKTKHLHNLMNLNDAGNFQVRLMLDIDRSINLENFDQFRNVFCRQVLSNDVIKSGTEHP